MTPSSVVIVGAGQGGYQVAASLRQGGFEGEISLVGAEPGLPYQRPPLSKAYLTGQVGAAALRCRPAEFYEQQRIRLLHDEVTALDRQQRRVRLQSGAELGYDHLVLATGARNRLLDVPGHDAAGVLGLRSLADADAIAAVLPSVSNVVVIGAGFIGLEFAAVAAARGLRVTVLELGARPMARAVSEPMACLFAEGHKRAGVNLLFGQAVSRIVAPLGRVTSVETTAGEVLAADLVIYGIGVLPNDDLAAAAGLQVDNGVLVDSQLISSDPQISALGDVARFPCAHSASLRRLESVQNAVDQARAVAARLMNKPADYAALPWFWTDQGNLKLQIAGLSDGHDRLVCLGSAEQQQLSVLCFAGERLIAVESVNRPADHAAARRLLAREAPLTPRQAEADGFDLRAFELQTRSID